MSTVNTEGLTKKEAQRARALAADKARHARLVKELASVEAKIEEREQNAAKSLEAKLDDLVKRREAANEKAGKFITRISALDSELTATINYVTELDHLIEEERAYLATLSGSNPNEETIEDEDSPMAFND